MKFWVAAIVVASVALAACGSSNGGDPDAQTEISIPQSVAPARTLADTPAPASAPQTIVAAPETGTGTTQQPAETDSDAQPFEEEAETFPDLLASMGLSESPPFDEDVLGRLESLAATSEIACQEWVESSDPDILPSEECQQTYADLCQAMNETAEYDDAPASWGDAARMVCLTARMVSSDLQITEDTVDCLYSSSERCRDVKESLCENYEELVDELEYLSTALPASEITEEYVDIVQLVRGLFCLNWLAR